MTWPMPDTVCEDDCGCRQRCFSSKAVSSWSFQTKSLGTAILVMVSFSLFVQMAEGSSYGIVPYVDPSITGSISGIVGAGGNTGAVLFSLGFRQLPYKSAFQLMASVIIGSCFLSVFIFIKGHPGLICGGRSATEEVVKPESDSALTDGCGSDGSDEEEGLGDTAAVTVVKLDDDDADYDIDSLTAAKHDNANDLSIESQKCIEESIRHAHWQ